MNEKAAGTSVITECAINLSQITKMIEAMAVDTNSRTVSIGEVLDNLKSNRKQTEEAVQKINTVTFAIQDSMKSLITQAEYNNDIANRLDTEINKFKLVEQ